MAPPPEPPKPPPAAAATSGWSYSSLKASLTKYGKTGVLVYLGLSSCVTAGGCGNGSALHAWLRALRAHALFAHTHWPAAPVHAPSTAATQWILPQHPQASTLPLSRTWMCVRWWA